MSTASQARQSLAQKSRYHRTTRQTKDSFGTLVWDSSRGPYDRGLNKPCKCGKTDKKTGRVLKFKRCCGRPDEVK